MKKIPSHTLLFLPLLLLLITANNCKRGETKQEKLLISVSLPPQQFFIQKIAGDLAEVHVLVPKGSNPEYYDPTPRDLVKLGESDAYFTIGTLPFELQWIAQLPEQVKVVNTATLLPEEYIYGHDGEAAHTHLHGDPHYWSSLAGGKAMAEAYLQELLQLLPEQEEQLRANYTTLLALFDQLEQMAKQNLTTEGGKQPAFIIYHPSLSLFSDEMRLRQLVIEENGLEPTPRHLLQLMEEAKQYDTRAVLIQQEFDQKNAQNIAQELQLPIVQIQPLNPAWDEEMRHLIKALGQKH